MWQAIPLPTAWAVALGWNSWAIVCRLVLLQADAFSLNSNRKWVFPLFFHSTIESEREWIPNCHHQTEPSDGWNTIVHVYNLKWGHRLRQEHLASVWGSEHICLMLRPVYSLTLLATLRRTLPADSTHREIQPSPSSQAHSEAERSQSVWTGNGQAGQERGILVVDI